MPVITTRLEKDQDAFRVEIPQEYIEKLGWRKGQILSIDVEGDKLEIKHIQGFMGE